MPSTPKPYCIIPGCGASGYCGKKSIACGSRGHIICASTDPPAGYYIAADRQEAARFVRSMESRRREIGRAIKAVKKYIASSDGGNEK